MRLPSLNINDLIFYYDNLYNAKQSYTEIFEKKTYFFKSNKKAPFIIDCGSNIGLSVIFFKQLYPDAEILCFEPTPIAFKILKKNISIHKLKNIKTINKAIAGRKNKIKLYGEIFNELPNTSGNSIIADWGNRGYTDEMKVNSVVLSDFVNKDVDLLKLDIEAAEQQVLEELIFSGKMRFIKQIALEIHTTKSLKDMNNFPAIKELLKDFELIFQEKNTNSELPQKAYTWMNKTGARLYSLRAIKKDS